MTDCINLKKRFGKKYRIVWDESRQKREDDPWFMQIPCLRGHIYPHGGDRLGFASNSRGPSLNVLKAIPGVEVEQDGTDGANLSFPVDIFDQIAKLVRPRQKRQRMMSEAQKATAAAQLASYRSKAKLQSDGQPQISV
jgi:hypothetical protein